MKKNTAIWGGVGLAAVVAATIILLKRKTGSTEKPPKHAPQLGIRNPGDQSEFTTSPEETNFER